MLREEDLKRIEALKRRLAVDKKVEVVRAGLALLEKEADRRERVMRWKRAARAVTRTSREVNADFQPFSRIELSWAASDPDG